MISEKQLAANQQNALKSTGPTSEAGKAIASKNSLKHGLLAKEVVITEGDGAEDQQAFDTLLESLLAQYAPDGSLEEMLVEKIAVSYWRLRRANRFEVGLLRRELDNAADKFYNTDRIDYFKRKRTDADIDVEMGEFQEALESFEESRRKLSTLLQTGQPLSKFYDDDLWFAFAQHLDDEEQMSNINTASSETIHNTLRDHHWTDDQISKELLSLCDTDVQSLRSHISQLKKEKADNALALQVQKKINSLPGPKDVERLLRYETAIERQLYKAISQLERCQRQRKGDYVPAPVQVDLNIDGLKTET